MANTTTDWILSKAEDHPKWQGMARTAVLKECPDMHDFVPVDLVQATAEELAHRQLIYNETEQRMAAPRRALPVPPAANLAGDDLMAAVMLYVEMGKAYNLSEQIRETPIKAAVKAIAKVESLISPAILQRLHQNADYTTAINEHRVERVWALIPNVLQEVGGAKEVKFAVLLKELMNLKMQNNEDITIFTERFNNLVIQLNLAHVPAGEAAIRPTALAYIFLTALHLSYAAMVTVGINMVPGYADLATVQREARTFTPAHILPALIGETAALVKAAPHPQSRSKTRSTRMNGVNNENRIDDAIWKAMTKEERHKVHQARRDAKRAEDAVAAHVSDSV
jgi:hypothetical protein